MRIILLTLCLASVCMTVVGLWCFGCARLRNTDVNDAECAVGENLSFIECEDDETICLKENYFSKFCKIENFLLRTNQILFLGKDKEGYFGGRRCGQEINLGYGNTCEELIQIGKKQNYIDHTCHSCKGNYCNQGNEIQFNKRIVAFFFFVVAILCFNQFTTKHQESMTRKFPMLFLFDSNFFTASALQCYYCNKTSLAQCKKLKHIRNCSTIIDDRNPDGVPSCVSASFVEILAILCYDCVTANSEKCNQGKGLEFMQCYEPINYDKQMNNSRSVCLKGIDTVNGIEKIFRGCAIKDGPEDSCKKLAKSKPSITCMTCEEDFCNSANLMEMKIWVIGVFIFISSYFRILHAHLPTLFQ
ncbi:hypothetical protein PVAND_012493 [Polypedilum vanderplanki]|uniref:Protein sleepless n=1 Tax=Polypedilum vanderplanki TaxID=319348 RepID=A0A9J6CML1_POLVA|nr:hypothetical protein PVAND_012493 [Polypedilum vanderplanki]